MVLLRHPILCLLLHSIPNLLHKLVLRAHLLQQPTRFVRPLPEHRLLEFLQNVEFEFGRPELRIDEQGPSEAVGL